MSPFFQQHAGMIELVLVEGTVILIALRELWLVRRSLRQQRQRRDGQAGSGETGSGQAGSGQLASGEAASPATGQGGLDGRPAGPPARAAPAPGERPAARETDGGR